MGRKRFSGSLPLAFLLALTASSGALAQPALTARAEVSGALRLYFKRAGSVGHLPRGLRGGSEAPVLIRLASYPTDRDVRELTALGVVIERRADGSPRGNRDVIAATMSASVVDVVAAHPRVRSISLDGAPIASPPPLDGTTAEIQAQDAWRSRREPTGSLTGKGVIVCDIDSGIDPFHPLFFRADGGYKSWVDVDGDGKFSAGIDAVDLAGDGSPTVLRVLNTPVTNYFDDAPLFGSDDPAYEPGMDWLYADVNGNSARDYGVDSGFTEVDPTYGERLFMADDVNGNGVVDVGEKLVALGTSKIKALRVNKKKYRRGQNLINAPQDPECAHGTGASGVMAGGVLGLTRLVGVAPDADIVMASNTDGTGELTLADFCVDEGARVVLHEYAPWVGYHLDGSSPLETFIDDTVAKDVAHINPAGNLSTSKKLYKQTIASGEETIIPVEAPSNSPYGQFTLMVVSILWRETSRPLTITLEDPTGLVKAAAASSGQVISTTWVDNVAYQSVRDDSTRGTARTDLYVYADTAAGAKAIPLGTWKVHVTDGAPAGSPGVEIIGYVLDEASGWGQGIYFPEDSSEDHLIGYPGTADHGLAVAAYTGHGFNGGTPGERAGYSGRGRRIDGVKNLWISAPDDPISAGFHEGSPPSYMIFGGTSGASPHVAGAAALLIQADPSRTGDDVREAIKAGAFVDTAVGTAPNEDYGYGKLRVYRSLFGEDPPGGSGPSIVIERAMVELGEAGEAGEVPVEVSDADEPAEKLRLDVDRDYDGVYDEEVTGGVLSVKSDALGVFTSKVRVMDATGRTATALAVVEIIPKKPVPPVSDPLVAAGGCGCSAPGEGRSFGAWALAAAGLAAVGLRSRGRRGSRPLGSL